MLKYDKISRSESVERVGVRRELGTGGYDAEYLDITFVGLDVRKCFIIKVNATKGW
jgi:hypothetical protein